METLSGRVLLISVSNVVYPVDLDLIHQIFSKYGTVEKIVSFGRCPGTFQALLQFGCIEEAVHAQVDLNGRQIYTDCNTLEIQPSHMRELTVKYNSSKAWDYTIDPAGPSRSIQNFQQRQHDRQLCLKQQILQALDCRDYPMHFDIASHTLQQHRRNTIFSNSQTPVIIVYNIAKSITVQMLFNLFSIFGVVSRIKFLRENPSAALIQFAAPLFAALAQTLMQGVTVSGQPLQVALSKNREVHLPPAATTAEQCKDFHQNGGEKLRTMAFSMSQQRYGALDTEKFLRGACRPTRVLFVCNLSPSLSPNDIKNLFGAFGTVKTISVLTNRGGGTVQNKVFPADCEFHTTENDDLKCSVVESGVDECINFGRSVDQGTMVDNKRKLQMVLLLMAEEGQAIDALMRLHNREVAGRPLKVAFSRTVL